MNSFERAMRSTVTSSAALALPLDREEPPKGGVDVSSPEVLPSVPMALPTMSTDTEQLAPAPTVPPPKIAA